MNFYRFSIILLCSILLCSCASIKRLLTIDDVIADVHSIDSLYCPSGILEEHFYKCSPASGTSMRRMLVYLPADYYESERRYPVQYLFHGARGNETSWIKDGNMIAIVDSLWREKLLPECIVVLPNMNQYKNDKDYGMSRFKRPVESIFETNGGVESCFVEDAMGYVRDNFRTIEDKAHRSVAGLSVGAMQAIYLSAANPDLFDYIGLFSPMHQSVCPFGKYVSFYHDLDKKQAAQFKCPPKLYYVMIGHGDVFYEHTEDFRYTMDLHSYPYLYFETRGGHTWDNWQFFLKEYLTKVFE